MLSGLIKANPKLTLRHVFEYDLEYLPEKRHLLYF